MLSDVFSRLYADEGLRLGSFDEGAFLAATEETGEPAGERLRLLAIWQEDHSAPVDPGDWDLLEHLYDLARARQPDSASVPHSKGVAALRGSALLDPELHAEEVARLRDVARDALAEALALESERPDTLYALGLLDYEGGQASQAEAWFRRALVHDPGDPQARLYLGHCLHDQRRWAAAVDAYEQVVGIPLARALSPWRVSKLAEQIALCRLRLGQRQEALRAFEEILARYEQVDADSPLPDDLTYPDELVEAAATDLRQELAERVSRLVARRGWGDLYGPALNGEP